MPMPALKNSLDIRLTESVVFLRTGDGTGRTRHGSQPAAPPAMVRGLLTLNIVKPTKISSIEIELTGKTRTAWPEGVGSRRVEVNEEHKIHSQSYVLFKAGSNANPATHSRTMSVGPGLYLEHDDQDDRTDESSEHVSTEGHNGEGEVDRRGREPIRGRQRERPVARRLSADAAHFQPHYVSHRNEQLPTPPYSPAYSRSATPITRSPAPSVMSPIGLEDSPQRSAEELRELQRSGSEYTSHTERSRSASTSRMQSPTMSRRVSFDDEPRRPGPEFIMGSSTGHIQAPSFSPGPSRSALSRGGNSVSPHLHDDRGRRGRISIGMFLDAVKEKVRSVSRATDRDTPPHSLTRDGRGESSERRESSRSGRTRERREHSALERVTEVLGLESEEEEDDGEGWKEFRKGVYTYPISFVVPPGSPPTLACDFGTVIWKLKAYAHRPGTFTTKLSASQEVTIVASPSEDDTEDTENIIVERAWETQMQYLIVISGRSFPIGGTIPFSITFMPLTKMKIFRLQVVLEERVDYYSDFRKVARTDPIARILLLVINPPRHKEHPILPLNSEDAETYKTTPLYNSASSPEELSERMSDLMGPGPWTVQKNLQLPKSCNEIHFTNKNKKSNIMVSHTLKVIFRVQRGDDEAIDKNTGKRKMFDIVIQTPIHILSCLCGPDFTALPPYSEATQPPGTMTSPALACNCAPQYLTSGRTGDASPRGAGAGSERHPHILPHPVLYMSSMFSHGDHAHSPSPSRAHSANGLPLSGIDTMVDRNTQYERLMAGHESEMGEAPPAYEDISTVA
ncbi:hypothetical protein BDW22DRAFT_1356137 [Trametopsis cervina]|nr:hypothetical protein BDW22DRAFT_1356137 [Trametopsis cervina]